ncbi:MAG: ABC transporter permease [Chloroflexota bacterium]
MSFGEVFRIAIESLLINRLRSALTTLGIIIGVGAVIALVSLGRAVESYIDGEFESLGATILEVSSTQPESLERTRVEPLTTLEAEALALRSNAPSILNVATTYRLFGSVTGDGASTSLSITGASSNYADVVSWDVRFGSFITEADVSENARVAVLGLDIVEALYGDRAFNPVGQDIRINQVTFTVTGVMSQRGGTFISEDNVVFIPITTAQSRLASVRTRDGGFQVSTIFVEVETQEDLDMARQEITAYLDEAHDIVFADERDYAISSDAGLVATINTITGVLTIFLGMIAAISLLVGGIGIMNIMLVSVTERTREIGLRKAVGAQSGDILLQFLLESVVLSLIGGVLGIGVAYIAAQVGTALYEQLTMTIELDSILLATGVSTLVGVFFGYYPARRAARMKPIDALRFE